MNFFRSIAPYRPAQIVLFRHAEKPSTGPELSEQGLKRSQLLPTFFNSRPSLIEFGPPASIIAAKPYRLGGSIRSIQTVIPLSNYFQIPINENFFKDDFLPLTSAIFHTPQWHNKTIVICWNREGLPRLARILGANSPIFWEKNCFNKFWIIRYKDRVAPIFYEIIQESV